jgi:hypothetical protein
MKRIFLLLLLLSSCYFPSFLHASIYPVSLTQRVKEASVVALVEVEDQQSFQGEGHIFTLHRLKVKAYLKGHRPDEQLGLISLGGSLAGKGQRTYPSVQVYSGNEYLVFLEEYPERHPDFPNLWQGRAYASVQGVMPKVDGLFQDIFADPLTERELFEQVSRLSGTPPLGPDGTGFSPRPYAPRSNASRMASISSVTTIGGGSIAAGTIDTNRVAVITGSGFDPFGVGPTGSTVAFSNAADGGLSFVPLDYPATDILLWSDTEIRVKIPGGAGTGNVQVSIFGNGVATAPLNIAWAVIPQYSQDFGWLDTQRQRLEYLKENAASNPGYAFQFSSAMLANIPAIEAFLRAAETWRCNTGVNLNFDQAANNDPFINGNGSQVRFETAANLGVGVLGQAHLRFRTSYSASTPTCVRENTLWYITDLDLKFLDNPAPFSWNFGPQPTAAGSYDFESEALKLIGLAIGLGYINQSNTAMYHLLNPATDIRTLNGNETVAGSHKVTHSILVTPCKLNLAPTRLMSAVSGGSCVLNLDQGGDLAQPRSAGKPFALRAVQPGQLTFIWQGADTGPLWLSLLDASGREVGKFFWENMAAGEVQLTLPGLSQGMYFFRLHTEQEVWQGKWRY